jgi:hypothetical protein
VPDDLRAHEPYDGHHLPVLREKTFWRCQTGTKAAVQTASTAACSFLGYFAPPYPALNSRLYIFSIMIESNDAMLYRRICSVLPALLAILKHYSLKLA